LRSLFLIIGALVLTAIVFFAVTALWLVPGLVKREVKRNLSKLSEGSVSIEQVRTSYTGQVVVKRVQFSDKAKRRWLSAEKMTINLARWPGLHPVIESLQIDGLDLRLSTENGKLLMPTVNWPEPSDDGEQKSEFNGLTINQATITILDADGVGIVYEDIALSVFRTGNSDYEFALNRISGDDSQVFIAGGDLDMQSAEFDLSLQIKHRLTKTETAVVCTALNVPEASAEGRLIANLTVGGYLKKPLGFQYSGNIELHDCIVFLQQQMLAENLALSARLDGQRLDVSELTATVCDGPVTGKFYAEIEDERLIKYQGRVQASDVNYPELTSVLTADTKRAARGSLSGNYNFSGRQNDPNGLQGEGLVFMNDIDVSVLPVIPAIFEFLGLSRIEPLKMSDTEAKFRNNGPLVTIESGHISNPFAAIEIEPGGTVNLQTEQVEGYVIAAPLRKITGLIERLPVIDIFANLKDKLIRLRVKGNWSDPPSKLISKTPIEDIRDSTIGFLQDVARTGGQFGKGMLDMLGDLLKINKNKDE